MFHINKIHIEHLHMHNDEKLDEILEAINGWHDKEIEEVIKKLKVIKKDIKSTPIK